MESHILDEHTEPWVGGRRGILRREKRTQQRWASGVALLLTRGSCKVVCTTRLQGVQSLSTQGTVSRYDHTLATSALTECSAHPRSSRVEALSL